MLLTLLRNPSIYAAIAALLAALGIDIPDVLWDHIVAAAGAIVAIVSIVFGITGSRKS